MRLTNKETKIKLSDTEKYDLQDHKMFNKLSDLEDIEEQYGIDLITLFKALKNGIWSKGGYYDDFIPTNEPYFITHENIEIGFTWYSERDSETDWESTRDYENQLCFYQHIYEDKQYIVRLKDYGKTWALTKEELL